MNAIHARNRFLENACNSMSNPQARNFVDWITQTPDASEGYYDWAIKGYQSNETHPDLQFVAFKPFKETVRRQAEKIQSSWRDFKQQSFKHGGTRKEIVKNRACQAILSRFVGCYLFSIVRPSDQPGQSYLRFPFIPDTDWLETEEQFASLFGYLDPQSSVQLLAEWKKTQEQAGSGLGMSIDPTYDASGGIRALAPALWRDIAAVRNSQDISIDYALGHRNMLVWPVGRDPDRAPEDHSDVITLLLFVSPVDGFLHRLLGVGLEDARSHGDPLHAQGLEGHRTVRVAARKSLDRDSRVLLELLNGISEHVRVVETPLRDEFGVILKHRVQRLEYVSKLLRELATNDQLRASPDGSKLLASCWTFIDLVLGTLEESVRRYVHTGERTLRVERVDLGRYLRTFVRSEIGFLPHVRLYLDSVEVTGERGQVLPDSASIRLAVGLQAATLAINGFILNCYEHNEDWENAAGIQREFKISVLIDTISTRGRISVNVLDNGRVARVPEPWRTWKVPRYGRFHETIQSQLDREYGSQVVSQKTTEGYQQGFTLPLGRPEI